MGRGRYDFCDVYLSHESDDEVGFEEQSFLMNDSGMLESAVLEFTHNYQVMVSALIDGSRLP